MIKILSVVIAGLLALWTTHRSAPETAPTSAAASLALIKHQLPEHQLEPVMRPPEFPRVSFLVEGEPPCGISYAEDVVVAVGEDYLHGPFPTEKAAQAWIDVFANGVKLRDWFLSSLTAHLPCGSCNTGNECGRTVWYEVGGFGVGVAEDPATGDWYAYVECTAAATLYVTCWPCPL